MNHIIWKTQNLKLFASFMDYPRFKLYWYQWKNSASNHLSQSGDGVIVISNGFPNGNWPFHKMRSVLFISHGVSCMLQCISHIEQVVYIPPECVKGGLSLQERLSLEFVKGGVSLLRMCERWCIAPENVMLYISLEFVKGSLSLLRMCERWSISPQNVSNFMHCREAHPALD